MNKQKLELITLIVISLVVVGVAFFTFFVKSFGGPLPITNIIIAVGLLTYMAFSVISFQKFDGKITVLSAELEEKKQALEAAENKNAELQSKNDKAKKEISEFQKTVAELEEKLATLKADEATEGENV
ncbi:MAG: hypothetical protein JJU02_01375 [Cryomorphaceae bacterium]|nr:hypothetical protein [Cryomorphaceae bacterium]